MYFQIEVFYFVSDKILEASDGSLYMGWKVLNFCNHNHMFYLWILF